MSDTDDTDVLLLIPPDFFLIQSDSDESRKENELCDPHCGVVGSLINQVHNLENRLNRLEVCSIDSCNSTILPLSEMSEQPYKYDNYITTSTKSTPQKPKHKLTLSSLPSTPSSERPGSSKYKRPPRFTSRLSTRVAPGPLLPPSTHNQSTDGDETYLSSSPEKVENEKMLGEIDKFLSNVKTIQQVSSKHENQQIEVTKPIITLSDLNVFQEPEKRFSELNLQEINELLHTMESQHEFVNLKDTKIESLYENKNFTSHQTWQCGDLKDSVPDFGFGARDMNYLTKIQVPTLEEQDKDSSPQTPSKSESQSNSEQTLSTIKEVKNLKSKSSPAVQTTQSDQLKNNTCDPNPKDEVYEIPKDLETSVHINTGAQSLPSLNTQELQTPIALSNISSINLFGLADIWHVNGKKDIKISDKEMMKLLPKLEEEKCRRRHCEKLIQELQMKILEMQQRLAVAVQVDSAKDEAILKFHEAWEKVANRWKHLETERNTLSKKLLTIEKKSSTEMAEVSQKVVQYELEMTKALNIARSSQEKLVDLELERNNFSTKLSELKLQLETSQDKLATIAKEKEQLNDKISLLEAQSSNDKKMLAETQTEIAKSKAGFLSCQKELSILKIDYSNLEERIKEKKTVIYDLEVQNNNLHISLEKMQKNEAVLQQQIRTLQEESERAKLELRNFYQQQVETLVKDKLKEFQDQLEQAEKSLQEELHNREQYIARTAAKQIQKLADKHRLEVQLIEEKHREEVRLYELRFSQMKQQINMLQSKLQSYQARQTNIAQELHNVMEQQWLEALRIINSEKSPVPSQHESQHKYELSLHELKNILSSKDGQRKNQPQTLQSEPILPETKIIPQEPNLINPDSKVPRVQDEERINKRISKYTVTDQPGKILHADVCETPISSKQKVDSQNYSENELQKYIQMLLSKLTKTEGQLSSQESSSSDFVDVTASWPQVEQHQQEKTMERPNTASRDRSNKPPWK